MVRKICSKRSGLNNLPDPKAKEENENTNLILKNIDSVLNKEIELQKLKIELGSAL